MSSFKVKIVNSLKEVHNTPSINIKDTFRVNLRVKHKEDNLEGIITDINKKIIVTWSNNMIERLSFDDALNELLVIDNTHKVDEVINNILDSDLVNHEEDKLEKPDIEKIKLQRKVEKLEKKLTNKTSNSLKEKIANEIIDVMIAKNMIEEDDKTIELQKITMMDDEQFNEYKSKVLSFNDDGHSVSVIKDEVNDNLSEAEKALYKIKNNGGRGIIGDFSQSIPTSVETTTDSDLGSKRSLGEIADKKITFENQYIESSFDEQFTNILSSKVNKKTAKSNGSKFNESKSNSLPGFENLQGLTKPIRINDKSASQFPTNTSVQDLINGLEWTTVSKIH